MAVDWQPSVSLAMLRARAELLQKIRSFMAEQGILEVETPHLVHTPVTEPNIGSFYTVFEHPGRTGPEHLYLHTSPEYAMKRLLAAGSGSIYQICKVFRNDEAGSCHNPEFTMLEWYQTGQDHQSLMSDLNHLLKCLQLPTADKQCYADAFFSMTQLDPHTAPLSELQACAREFGLASDIDDHNILLDFIFSHVVAPGLGHEQALFIHDFPVCQAALARLSPTDPPVAERFELFMNGMEIANGFHELTDPAEQRRRFEEDNRRRVSAGKPEMPLDEQLLAALEAGLPDCAGVALGIDRLLMATHRCRSIEDVMTFPFDRA